MKKLILIICLLAPNVFFAQTTNPELDKFVGTWIWSSGNDEVKITLQKQPYINPLNGKTIEMLVGWHSYTQNGLLVESSMANVGTDVNNERLSTSTDLKITLRGSTRTPTSIHFSTFWDLSLHKNCVLDFTLLPGSTTQATWKLNEGKGVYFGPQGTAGLITLPSNIVLTKQ